MSGERAAGGEVRWDLSAAEERIICLEEQLRSARRLAGVSQLAAGVAHSFNNALTAILGHVEVGLQNAGSERVREDLICIRDVARSSAALAQQLAALASGERGLGVGAEVDVVVRELERLLGRALGSGVTVSCDLGAPGARLVIARGPLEQLLLNLVLNAKGHLNEGGALSLETQAMSGAASGRVLLRVSATGSGSSALGLTDAAESSVRSGLGLPMVRTLVEDAGGVVRLDRGADQGAVVEIELPLVDDSPAPSPADAPELPTVLLVEDDAQVRRLLGRILKRSGYKVISASSGEEALHTVSADGGIDLLLTDVVMPGMGGGELAARALDSRPKLPVLFVSGYTGDALRKVSLAGDTQALLYKPFSTEQLLSAVSGLIHR